MFGRSLKLNFSKLIETIFGLDFYEFIIARIPFANSRSVFSLSRFRPLLIFDI
jgi:hypothetical protein